MFSGALAGGIVLGPSGFLLIYKLLRKVLGVACKNSEIFGPIPEQVFRNIFCTLFRSKLCNFGRASGILFTIYTENSFSVFQLLFTPLEEAGFNITPYITINIYTAPALLCTILNLVVIAVIQFKFDDHLKKVLAKQVRSWSFLHFWFGTRSCSSSS